MRSSAARLGVAARGRLRAMALHARLRGAQWRGHPVAATRCMVCPHVHILCSKYAGVDRWLAVRGVHFQRSGLRNPDERIHIRFDPIDQLASGAELPML